MSGGPDFRAAIEEAKRRAKQQYADRKLGRKLGSRGESEPVVSPSVQAPALRSPVPPSLSPLTVSTSIPGLGDARQGDGEVSPRVKSEENLSPTRAATLENSVPVPPPSSFASLRPAWRLGPNGAGPVKRPLEVDDDGEDTTKPSKRPFAPPKKPTRVSRPGSRGETSGIDTRTSSKSSEWYDNINMKEKFPRNDLISLQQINMSISQCQKEASRDGHLAPFFAKIRQRIHQMEFFDFLTGVIMKKSKVLDDRVGLPQIFYDAGGVEYPWDIKADAQALYLRWLQGILDPHLLRGVHTSRRQRADGRSGVSHSLEKDYPARRSCNVVGDNGLQNGQWWPMQICAMRDGAHGEIEAGIHGQPGSGAFSIILSSGGYEDRDEGERILYCGTSGSDGKPTAGTRHMKESHQLRGPVRVLRSAGLHQTNKYRPAKGLRYDGLYDVVDYEILDAKTAMHRFSLRRRPGQDPIRYEGVERRPTDEEVAAYVKIRKLIGLTG
ncbi:MAG: hypothetical protein M1832_003816 [Thelocarpon impressellum]|nr:MAG: hypothetical protein M1832_003816 [Thelocarpon impressellum]